MFNSCNDTVYHDGRAGGNHAQRCPVFSVAYRFKRLQPLSGQYMLCLTTGLAVTLATGRHQIVQLNEFTMEQIDEIERHHIG